jgi:pyrroline-5-carboxylate reductase
MSKTRIAFIGAGNMASSLIGGLLAKGLRRCTDPRQRSWRRHPHQGERPNTVSTCSPTTKKRSRAST